jgi:hypothetical protein
MECHESNGNTSKMSQNDTCTYESKSKVSFGGEVSDEFPVTTGLRQGGRSITSSSIRVSYTKCTNPSQRK